MEALEEEIRQEENLESGKKIRGTPRTPPINTAVPAQPEVFYPPLPARD